MHAQGIVPKSHMFVSKVSCYQKLHTHIRSILLLKLTYKLMQVSCCFIHIYLYTYAHFESQFHVMHTLAFIWKGIFMPSIYTLKGNSTSYVHFGKHSRATFRRVYIYKALDHLFQIYTFYLKGIWFLLLILYVHGE